MNPNSLVSVLPHQPPMRLVTRCLEVSDTSSLCEVDLRDNPLFAASDAVPSMFAVEMIAQCGALILAAEALASGSPRGGRLVSARKFTFARDTFSSQQPLQVEVSLLNSPADAMLLFEGAVSADGDPIANGQVAVFRSNE